MSISEKKTNSSRRSSSLGSESQRSYSSSGLIRQVKESLFEIFISVNSSKGFAGQSTLLLVFEVLCLLFWIFASLRNFFLWDPLVAGDNESPVRYLFLMIDPMALEMDIVVFTSVFLTVCFCVTLGICGILFVMYTKSSNELMMVCLSLFFRGSRTFLMFPFMSVLLSPCRCVFSDGSVDAFMATGKCYDFPNLLYVIIGVALACCLLVIGVCDCLFLLQKYKGTSSWTSAPDGRFNLLLYILQVAGLAWVSLTLPQDLNVLGIVGNVLFLLLSCVLLILIVRFIPWFHFQYVFMVASTVLIYVTICGVSVFSYSTESYYPSIGLTTCLVTLPLLWILLCVRYVLLLAFFRKRIRSNILLCFFNIDIAIGIFVRQHFRKLCNLKKCFKKTKKGTAHRGVMTTTTSIEMIKVIQTLLDDEDFEKTKGLCAHLLTLVIDTSPLLAKAVLNHTHTIMRTSQLDVEHALEFYQLKITNFQEVGAVGDKNSRRRRNRVKMMNELSRARKREDTLSKLIRMLLLELNSEDRKVSFSNFPRIVSTIQNNMEFCEKIYARAVKVFPSPTTYRRYANYLLRFAGDSNSAKLYLKEANQLEFNKREDSSARSAAGLSLIGGGERELKKKIPSHHPLERKRSEKSVRELERCESTSSSSDGGSVEYSSDFSMKHYQINKTSPSNEDEQLVPGEEELRTDLVDEISNCTIEPENQENDSRSSESESTQSDQRSEEDDVLLEPVPASPGRMSRCESQSANSLDQRSFENEGNINVINAMESALSVSKSTVTNGTKLTGRFTSKSMWETLKGGDEKKHVQKKVMASKYISTYLIRCYCCCVLFFVVGGIVAIFALSLTLDSSFSKSAEVIEVASQTSKSVSEVFHLIRKLQVSYYDETVTPLPYERNSTAFRINLNKHCGQVLENVRFLYEEMSESERRPFKEIHLELTSRLKEAKPILTENLYETATFSLVDAVQVYGDMCRKIVEIPQFRWGGNTTIDEEYGRVQDEQPFFYIRLNEPYIVQGMEDLSKSLIDTESDSATIFMMGFVLVPVVLFLFFFLNCFSCLCFMRQQKRTFEGLLLIPRVEINRLLILYGEGDQEEVKEDQNNNEDEQSAISGNSSGSNHVRVDTVRYSMIQSFFCYSCGMICIGLLMFIVMTVMGILTCDQFVVRNREYDFTLHLEGEHHRIHLWTTEVLYRNDSLFKTEKVVDNAKREANSLTESYEHLRFGNEDLDLPGNDAETIPYSIYYKDACDVTQVGLSEFDKLYCQSMNTKVDYMRTAAKHIVETALLILESNNNIIGNSSNNNNGSMSLSSESGLVQLRGGKEYQEIIMIDNFSNGSLFDAGAIKKNFDDLKEYTKRKVDDYLSYLNNFSLLLLILFLPSFVVIYILLFRSSASRLNRNLTMPRQIMLLMKKEVLLSRNIYEYVTGKSGSSKNSFNKLFKNEKTNRIDATFDVLKMSSYGFVAFDKNLSIVHINSTSDELFRIVASNAKNLHRIFDKKSIRKIKSWMNRKLQTSFNGELVAIYEEQQYPVLADVCRSKNHNDLFIGIFENMESSKKKDLLKESERRTEKIEVLMRNILPRELAQSAKLEDFELGTCKVYVHKRATACFTDIADFSGMSQRTNPETIINMLHKLYCNMDAICEHHKLEKIKTIGDCYFCVSGIPTYKPLHAVTAMEFSIDVLKMIQLFNKKENPIKDFPISVRTGLSSGKLVAGIIGKTKRCYDIWGPMINQAARMESHGLPGKIQVARSTYESIFDRYEFMEREIQLQGIGNAVLAYVHTPKSEVLGDVSEVLSILQKAENVLASKQNDLNDKKEKKMETETPTNLGSTTTKLLMDINSTEVVVDVHAEDKKKTKSEKKKEEEEEVDEEEIGEVEEEQVKSNILIVENANEDELLQIEVDTEVKNGGQQQQEEDDEKNMEVEQNPLPSTVSKKEIEEETEESTMAGTMTSFSCSSLDSNVNEHHKEEEEEDNEKISNVSNFSTPPSTLEKKDNDQSIALEDEKVGLLEIELEN